MIEALALLLGALCCVAAGAALQWTLSRRRTRDERDLGTPVERATFHTLHTAALAAPPLRAGLTEDTARKAVRRLRSLLGTPALCLTDLDTALTWDGAGDHHRAEAMVLVADVLADGRPRVVGVACTVPGCDLRWAAVAPLEVDGRVLGALAAFGPDESPALLRATGEVARWVAVQLELAELDRSRSRLIEAEIRTLRAQISPHFIFNSLAAIASFVRTDPDRARELLLEFADFTRYSFRRHGDFTSLADELRSIDQYLALVRARFGDRLRVTLRVAPGAAGGAALPLPPAAGGERRQARHRGPPRRQPDRHHGRRRWLGGGGGDRGRRRRRGARAAARDPGRPGRAFARHRPEQRGRADAAGLRGRPRPDDRDRGRRRHEDHRPDPQVPPGRPGHRPARTGCLNRPLEPVA